MGSCGSANDHCCWFWGRECKYVTLSVNPDFKWSCSLRAKYGSWETVHKSDEYLRDVQEDMHKVSPGGVDCGDWPTKGICNTCGMGVK